MKQTPVIIYSGLCFWWRTLTSHFTCWFHTWYWLIVFELLSDINLLEECFHTLQLIVIHGGLLFQLLLAYLISRCIKCARLFFFWECTNGLSCVQVHLKSLFYGIPFVYVKSEEAKGSDIMLEAILEAEVACKAKHFFSQSQNQLPNEWNGNIFSLLTLCGSLHLFLIYWKSEEQYIDNGNIFTCLYWYMDITASY